jgi:uncharacterized membrane protein
MFKKFTSQIIKYFLQGLLFIAPIGITVYTIIQFILWLDHLVPGLSDKPGLGIIIVFGGIFAIGFLGNTILARPIFDFLEHLLKKLPLVSVIYSSLKDFANAFLGNNRKFKNPVLVQLNKDTDVYKLGFITQTDLNDINIKDLISVYVPHSYNFSGDLFIVPKENVKELNVSGSEIMKFIVSGGVSGFEKGETKKR